MSNTTLVQYSLFSVCILALIGNSTGAAAQNAFTVCADRNGGTKQMTVTVSNRCVSSSYKYRGNNFEIDVQQNTATIDVTGDFDYKRPTGGIGTTDCGGAKTLEFKIDGTEARRYGVVVNGRYAGTIDFNQSNARACPKQHNRIRFDVPARKSIRLRSTHAKVDLTNWNPKQASSLMSLFKPITNFHPESTDGRPSLQIDAVQRQDGRGMFVQIVTLGLLDDSVSGMSYIGSVDEGASGWVLKQLWKRALCARGARAGQWTTGACP